MVYIFFFEQKLYYFKDIYFSGRKHALPKTAHLPNQTFESSAVYHKNKAYIHGNIFGTSDKSIRRILQLGKRLRDERYKQHSANLRNVSSRATDRCGLTLNFGDNVNHLHPYRCQPLTTVMHERRSVVLRVRGCSMTKYRHSLTGCKHSKGYFS